jgi:hypothetical protein
MKGGWGEKMQIVEEGRKRKYEITTGLWWGEKMQIVEEGRKRKYEITTGLFSQ